MPDRPRKVRYAERVGLALALVGVIASILWALSISQTNADRAAEDKARRVAQVEQCYASAATRPRLIAVLDAIGIITRNQLDHLLENPADRARTVEALDAIRSFREQTEINTPSARQCRMLAEELGVEPSRGTSP